MERDKTYKLKGVTKKLTASRSPKRTNRRPISDTKSSSRKKITGRKTKGKKISPWIVAGIVALFGIFFVFPYLFNENNSETGDIVPEGAYQFCLDISHHNSSDIVWDSLAVVIDQDRRTRRNIEDGKEIKKISTVIIKATEGTRMKDKKFNEFWEKAADAPIRRGAYHFFRTSTDPSEQADNYIGTVGKLRHSDFPPVLDLEVMHKGCTRKELNDKALIWLKKVEKHYGRKPVVYTPDSYAKDILSDEIKYHYPIWVAHYGVAAPNYKDWKMWQFTDKAVVHGIKGKVDLSVVR